MFDKYLIVEDSVRNTGPADAPTGFSMQVKLGYYRGLGLSMVEDLGVVVDGTPAERSGIRFDEGKGSLTLDEMETALDRHWAFGAPATVEVQRPGGLEAGSHVIGFSQRLRVSYMPFPSVNNDEKTIVI